MEGREASVPRFSLASGHKQSQWSSRITYTIKLLFALSFFLGGAHIYEFAQVSCAFDVSQL